MGILTNIIPASDLGHNTAKVMKRVKDSNEPVIITQRGRAAAVLISVESYERSEHEREILRALAKGEREIASGEGYDLESVLQEADLMLADG